MAWLCIGTVKREYKKSAIQTEGTRNTQPHCKWLRYLPKKKAGRSDKKVGEITASRNAARKASKHEAAGEQYNCKLSGRRCDPRKFAIPHISYCYNQWTCEERSTAYRHCVSSGQLRASQPKIRNEPAGYLWAARTERYACTVAP